MTQEDTKPAAPQVKMTVMTQYIRDMSFENIVAQKGLSTSDIVPEMQMTVALDARKRSVEHQYELVSK
ncbi:MAG: protein-export chaperone SecB, partial [Paracoccaceae bacterium]|nr:protein-export chaperone SecB [Paracoccaceae bacterium]